MMSLSGGLPGNARRFPTPEPERSGAVADAGYKMKNIFIVIVNNKYLT